MKVEIEVLEGGRAPSYATEGSAGLDLYPYPIIKRLYLEPYLTTFVPVGIKIAIPEGHVGLVCPRSGLALKHGLTVLNGPGVIDSDFRGELAVLLYNSTPFLVEVDVTDKPIAQLVIVPAPKIELVTVPSLDETVRGEGGFGSTDDVDSV